MEYCQEQKNSIQDSDEDTLKLRDLSVESDLEKVAISPSRKTQFKSFYKSQKTILVESDSSMDKPDTKVSFDNPEEEIETQLVVSVNENSKEKISVNKSIPEIFEDLVSKSEEDESFSEDITEYSDIKINKEDRSKIMNDIENLGFFGNKKFKESTINITQDISPSDNHLDVCNDTSDEDISELCSEQPSPMILKKSKLKISLRNLSDSEEEKRASTKDAKMMSNSKNCDENKEEDSTDESKIEVSEIGYVTNCQKHDNIPHVVPEKYFGKINNDEEPETHTDESDIEVTDMDYYKIRHQNDQIPTTEYSLSWSPKYALQSQDQDHETVTFKNLKLPRYMSRDIPDGFDYDGDKVEDEEIPCKEDDFMDIKEFLNAHLTDFDLEDGKGATKVKITNIPQETEECEGDEDTESLRESIISSSNSVHEYENYSEETDVSEIQTSYAENHHVQGEIVLMEHDDLEGTIAIYCCKNFTSTENLNKTCFKPELQDFTDDMDYEEAISEQIEMNSKEFSKDIDSTDEEDVSGMELPMHEDPPSEFSLPNPCRKLLKISMSLDGDINVTENELPELCKIKEDDDVPTEDELLEDFLMSPVENKNPKFPLSYSGSEGSKVCKREKNKLRCRRVTKEVDSESLSEEL